MTFLWSEAYATGRQSDTSREDQQTVRVRSPPRQHASDRADRFWLIFVILERIEVCISVDR